MVDKPKPPKTGNPRLKGPDTRKDRQASEIRKQPSPREGKTDESRPERT
jgi:hypothetical protein